MVIGKPVLTNEIGNGHVYEVICIPNTLTDEQVHIDIIRQILYLRLKKLKH